MDSEHFIFSEGPNCSVIRNQLCQLSPCWMFYRQSSVEAVAMAMMFQCEVFRVMRLPRGLMTRSTLSCHSPAWPGSTFNCGLMKFWFSRAQVTVTIRHHQAELLFTRSVSGGVVDGSGDLSICLLTLKILSEINKEGANHLIIIW